MIIDVFKLRAKGKEEQSFNLSYNPDLSVLSIPDAVFSKPAAINVLVEVYPDEVYCSGTVSYEITAPCSRCLSPVTKTRSIDFDERFLPTSRKDEEDDEALIYDRDKINLTRFINELIMTDMPYSVLCSDDCKGLCPVCGQNLNEADCGHHIE